jgi:hypothetical protein
MYFLFNKKLLITILCKVYNSKILANKIIYPMWGKKLECVIFNKKRSSY